MPSCGNHPPNPDLTYTLIEQGPKNLGLAVQTAFWTLVPVDRKESGGCICLDSLGCPCKGCSMYWGVGAGNRTSCPNPTVPCLRDGSVKRWDMNYRVPS